MRKNDAHFNMKILLLLFFDFIDEIGLNERGFMHLLRALFLLTKCNVEDKYNVNNIKCTLTINKCMLCVARWVRCYELHDKLHTLFYFPRIYVYAR